MPDTMTAHMFVTMNGILYGLLKLVKYRSNNASCGQLPKLREGAILYISGEIRECACLLTQLNKLLKNNFYVKRFNVRITNVIFSKDKQFPRVVMVVFENKDVRIGSNKTPVRYALQTAKKTGRQSGTSCLIIQAKNFASHCKELLVYQDKQRINFSFARFSGLMAISHRIQVFWDM